MESLDAGTTTVLLFFAGLVAGTLNVIAGGGSLLTLPLMIFMGLPAGVANGTNRVALLVQNVGAVASYHRHGAVDWKWLPQAALPGLLGAAAGTWFALSIDDDAFERVLAIVLVLVAVWTLWDPLGKRDVGDSMVGLDGAAKRLGVAVAFFLIGIYGGFVQAGVGFFVLALTTVLGLDLIRGNALKVLFVLTYTPLSLALFAWGGKVDWGYAVALAAGNFLGALIGVRLAVLKGHTWIRRVVTITVIVFAIRLWVWG